MAENKTGIIVKATGGFYYVATGDEVYECRARGLFRKEGMKPYVGDRVEIELSSSLGYVVKIFERKNSLIRPPLANIDKLALIISMQDPAPNPFVIDKLIAIAERRSIEPVIILTKIDLADPTDFAEIYRSAGFEVYTVSSKTGEGVEEVKAIFGEGRLTAFTGNTGAGKSSLVNMLDPTLELPTAEISKKLGRGRHTTRHVELYNFAGGLLADTPGFSAIELEQFELMLASELEQLFREFEPYIGCCKFTGCSHRTEKGCAVLEALENGEISKSRHDSYMAMYDSLKDVKEWQLNK